MDLNANPFLHITRTVAPVVTSRTAADLLPTYYDAHAKAWHARRRLQQWPDPPTDMLVSRLLLTVCIDAD